MNPSESSVSSLEQLFANDSPVLAVIAKKIRNRKKKLEKLTQKLGDAQKGKAEATNKDQKIDEVKAEIKELEEMRHSIQTEARSIIQNMQGTAAPAKVDHKLQDEIITHSLGRVADALLINLLQNQNGVRSFLQSNENAGLKAALIPLQSLISPNSSSLVYNKARECFVEVFRSLAKGSEDIIPGSSVSYKQLADNLDRIPAKSKNELISLSRVEEEKVASTSVLAESKSIEETKAPTKAVERAAPKEPTIEQLAEEDAKLEAFKVEKVVIAPKVFIDEDGFTHVKPHSRPAYEHDALKGRGRRGKKGRHGETDRLKVRGGKGGKPIRGRGQGHYDKHGIDEEGRKVKTAHGGQHWKKGEVRVEAPSTE